MSDLPNGYLRVTIDVLLNEEEADFLTRILQQGQTAAGWIRSFGYIRLRVLMAAAKGEKEVGDV